jgi:DNA repair protein RecN (Recombination protein N)
MLKSLEIQNYALIQNQTIQFDKGLNIITGETGAGKSILLGALGLVMGRRADTKVLFDADSKCIVEGRFAINGKGLEQFFIDYDIDYEDELVIRREITPAGKSRGFINDTPANLDVIQQLSDMLIDLHQQFDTLAMFKPKFQMEAIDALAELQKEVSDFKKEYLGLKSKEKELDHLQELAKNADKEKDYYSFLWKELSEAKLVTDEQKELETQVEILSNADNIKSTSSKVSTVLANGDSNIVDTLTDLAREYAPTAKIDPQYNAIYERLISAIEELKDIGNEAESISEDIEADPQQLFNNQERLNLIYKLEKKHNLNDVNELIILEDDLKSKLKKFENNSDDIANLEMEIEKISASLMIKAKVLSSKRALVLPSFESKVNDLLSLLSMPNARLKVQISEEKILNPSGINNVNFLFATNKGSEFLPIKDVASGGELSRLTLCIKAVLTEKMNLATMIFDEIDAGVSGEVSSKMGLILKDMAHNHQMISITHSPQIASKGDVHFWVYKQDEESRTISKMKVLNQEERITELAKMLSGDNPGKAAMDNAKELLNIG